VVEFSVALLSELNCSKMHNMTSEGAEIKFIFFIFNFVVIILGLLVCN
jgi:hypothetical protein